jgi:hypothetical protein
VTGPRLNMMGGLTQRFGDAERRGKLAVLCRLFLGRAEALHWIATDGRIKRKHARQAFEFWAGAYVCGQAINIRPFVVGPELILVLLLRDPILEVREILVSLEADAPTA